ncbi:hypothetical protein ACIPPJ_05990 [Streptomyces sp. NPDC086091]|uniref:hypothetical protein n=1 Tax=Streptomyces sp. NPDC086091 TaxID=3365751 RepID=UPI003829D144
MGRAQPAPKGREELRDQPPRPAPTHRAEQGRAQPALQGRGELRAQPSTTRTRPPT